MGIFFLSNIRFEARSRKHTLRRAVRKFVKPLSQTAKNDYVNVLLRGPPQTFRLNDEPPFLLPRDWRVRLLVVNSLSSLGLNFFKSTQTGDQKRRLAEPRLLKSILKPQHQLFLNVEELHITSFRVSRTYSVKAS